MIDLTPFCADPREMPRYGWPFSFGDWTYATDGYIAVRVPRRVGILESSRLNPNVLPWPDLYGLEPRMGLACRPSDVRPSFQRCDSCDGLGLIWSASGREECFRCDGAGMMQDPDIGRWASARNWSITLCNVRAMLTLPDLRVLDEPELGFNLLRFRFHGGVGLVATRPVGVGA